MNKDLIDKIINLIDLEFDALFFNHIVDEADIKFLYTSLRGKLKNIE